MLGVFCVYIHDDGRAHTGKCINFFGAELAQVMMGQIKGCFKFSLVSLLY